MGDEAGMKRVANDRRSSATVSAAKVEYSNHDRLERLRSARNGRTLIGPNRDENRIFAGSKIQTMKTLLSLGR